MFTRKNSSCILLEIERVIYFFCVIGMSLDILQVVFWTLIFGFLINDARQFSTILNILEERNKPRDLHWLTLPSRHLYFHVANPS